MSSAEAPGQINVPRVEFIPGSERVIFTEQQIDRRVRSMALSLAGDLAGLNPVFLWVRKGGIVLMEDLEKEFREIGFNNYDRRSISVSTYPRPGDFTQIARITRYPRNIDFTGRVVVGIDDVVDQGLTQDVVMQYLRSKGVAQAVWVSIVYKTARDPGGLHTPYLYGFRYSGRRWLWGRGMNQGLENEEDDEKTRLFREISGALFRFKK